MHIALLSTLRCHRYHGLKYKLDAYFSSFNIIGLLLLLQIFMKYQHSWHFIFILKFLKYSWHERQNDYLYIREPPVFFFVIICPHIRTFTIGLFKMTCWLYYIKQTRYLMRSKGSVRTKKCFKIIEKLIHGFNKKKKSVDTTQVIRRLKAYPKNSILELFGREEKTVTCVRPQRTVVRRYNNYNILLRSTRCNMYALSLCIMLYYIEYMYPPWRYERIKRIPVIIFSYF